MLEFQQTTSWTLWVTRQLNDGLNRHGREGTAVMDPERHGMDVLVTLFLLWRYGPTYGSNMAVNNDLHELNRMVVISLGWRCPHLFLQVQFPVAQVNGYQSNDDRALKKELRTGIVEQRRLAVQLDPTPHRCLTYVRYRAQSERNPCRCDPNPGLHVISRIMVLMITCHRRSCEHFTND